MKKVKLLFSLLLVVAFIAPVFAADVGGCDDDNNDMINPALALCSTHVYNIGQDTNPANESERDLMEEVIAMKTTVIAQQMYKQYSQMDTMLQRLRTQLEKAVLINKLKAASGDADAGDGEGEDGGSSSFKSKDKNIVLAGAQNCNKVTGDNELLSCLRHNLGYVEDAIREGKKSDARKQLEVDLKVATRNGITVGGCKSDSKKEADLQECVNLFYGALNQWSREIQKTVYSPWGVR